MEGRAESRSNHLSIRAPLLCPAVTAPRGTGQTSRARPQRPGMTPTPRRDGPTFHRILTCRPSRPPPSPHSLARWARCSAVARVARPAAAQRTEGAPGRGGASGQRTPKRAAATGHSRASSGASPPAAPAPNASAALRPPALLSTVAAADGMRSIVTTSAAPASRSALPSSPPEAPAEAAPAAAAAAPHAGSASTWQKTAGRAPAGSALPSLLVACISTAG